MTFYRRHDDDPKVVDMGSTWRVQSYEPGEVLTVGEPSNALIFVVIKALPDTVTSCVQCEAREVSP